MFPPESKNGSVSSIKQSDIEHNLDGITVAEVVASSPIALVFASNFCFRTEEQPP